MNVKTALELASLQARIELGTVAALGMRDWTDVTEDHYGRLERVSLL